MFEHYEVEQGGAEGAWWIFVLSGASWLAIALLVFHAV